MDNLPTTDDLEEIYEEVKKLKARVEHSLPPSIPLGMIAPLFEMVQKFD